jgi:hypothetical protein
MASESQNNGASWSNELVVRQSWSGKDVITKAEDIVGIRYQATMDEDSKLRRTNVCCSKT